MHGIPHHDPRNAEPPCQPCQRPQIFALVAPPRQRQHRLSRQPELVRYRHADAPVANVEA
jgi:hypothetical protein